MSAPTVEIAVDGGPGFGFGHISRSQTLARALQAAGASVRFSPRSAIAAKALAGWPRASGDEDILVIDLPYGDDAAITAAHKAGRPVAVLDHGGEARADLAIRTDPRRIPMAAQRCEYGLSYALIRPEVLAETPSAGDYALVCIGGSDLGDLGVAAAQRLAAASRDVILVRGPLAGPLDAAPPGVDVRTAPPNLPALIAGCAFAVTNAGTTALEAMALGKPVHVLAQTPAEQATAERFLADGIILGMGLDTLSSPDPARARTIAAAGRAAVDGKGAARVAALVLGLIG